MKKNLTFSKLLMLFVIAALPLSMMAQEGKKHAKPAEKYWYIQADGGLSINHGDLANYNGGIWGDFDHFKRTVTPLENLNWNAHFGIGYQFGKVIGLNLKGGYGLLSGHKHKQALVLNSAPEGRTYWNLGLDKTNYFEGNLNLTFNLFNLFNYNPRRVINLVPHIGIGGIYYKAGTVNQLDADDNVSKVRANQKSERELSYTVPAGMEITFNLAPKFDLFLDYTYLFTGTDNLDQVAKIKSDEDKHIINDKDMYGQFNLGLRVKFNDPCDIDKMARESKKITYRVNPDPLVEGEDGNVCFDVIVTIPGEYFEKKAVMNLKPYLAYNGGQIDIDPITFVGEKVKGEGDFRVNYKEGGEFTKHYCMPYQEEMANCELKGDPMFYVYDGTIYPTQDDIVKNSYYTQGATEKLADGVIAYCNAPTNVRPSVNENTVTLTWDGDADSYDVVLMKGNEVVQTVNVTNKNYTFNELDFGTTYQVKVISKCSANNAESQPASFSTEASVETPADFTFFFPKDSWDINKRSINKSVRAAMVEKLKEDPEIKGFKVEGWASPEGEDEHNENLSENRAASAKSDIEKQIKKAGKKVQNFEINIHGNGPDWDTFMKEVENSDLPDKNAILSGIRNSNNKEKTIKEMILIYPQLENDILPMIRRAEVSIIK